MRLNLREVTLDDGKTIIKWRNSDEIRKHCFSKKVISEQDNAVFFEQNVKTGKYKQFIVEKINEDFGLVAYPIACISLKDFDTENARCELCVFTSDDVEWNDENQYPAIKMILEKAFGEYGMHKVYSFVFADCLNEVRLLGAAGFKIEALLKQEAKDIDGNYVDIYRMAVLKDEWEK